MIDRLPIEFVYIATAGRHQKIGISGDPRIRMRQLGRFEGVKVEPVHIFHVPTCARAIEKYVKATLRHRRSYEHKSEWFRIGRADMLQFVTDAVEAWIARGGKPGAEIKFTPEKQKRAVAMVRAGKGVPAACKAVKVSTATFYGYYTVKTVRKGDRLKVTVKRKEKA